MGRDWVEVPGNLYCSTIVRLRGQDPAAHTLALVAGVAAHDAIVGRFEALDDRLRIKWPNDILWDGEKLCGILLERAGDAVIVGFGINVTGHPADLGRPVTSLAAIGGEGTASDVLADLVAAFAHTLQMWRVEGLRAVALAWAARALPPGTAVRVEAPDGEVIMGTYSELAEDGALILRLANGATRAIHTGDVFLI